MLAPHFWSFQPTFQRGRVFSNTDFRIVVNSSQKKPNPITPHILFTKKRTQMAIIDIFGKIGRIFHQKWKEELSDLI